MVRKRSGKLLRILLTLTLVVGLLPVLPQWAGAAYLTTPDAMYGMTILDFSTITDLSEYDILEAYYERPATSDSTPKYADLYYDTAGTMASYTTGDMITASDQQIYFKATDGGTYEFDVTFNGYGAYTGTLDYEQTFTITVEVSSPSTVPMVSTTNVTVYSATTATMGGNVTSDGGATVTERGVVYSYTDATPTIGEGGVTQDVNGSGTGTFSESVGSLAANTTYYIRAYATNSVGTTYGAVVSFTTDRAVPGAPTIGTATAGNGQATVSFTAPASNGGAAITGYTVTADPGGLTETGASSPITVTGLTNGEAYTFTVTATNSVGTSAASAPSNSVTPKGTQTITFTTADSYDFGTAPTLTATSDSGLTVSFSSSTTSVCTVTTGGALTFIKAGTATINADQAGNSEYIAAPTVSQTFTVNAVAPGAPTIGTATAGDRQASVAFTAPVFTGGESITGYTVTSDPGGFTGTGTASPIVVTGLANGTAYTFTVMATNTAGTSSASAASNAVTPKAPQTITFANPGAQNFGTAPTLTASSSSTLTVTFTSNTTDVCTITPEGALTFLKAGSATIVAHQEGNALYFPAEDVSQTFTVNAVLPGAPTIGTATAGDTQAAVSFSAPAFTGGVSITVYTVTASPGGATGTGTSSPVTVTGLTNGVAYTFTVTAANSVGTGPDSAVSNAVTPKAAQTITFENPGAQNFGTTPTLTATASSSLTVSFTSSSTDVATITSGGALTFVKPGLATIVAHQTGGGSYLPAPDVSQSFEVVAVAPGAPTGVTAEGGNVQAAVSFTAPAFTGGADITSYTVTSSPGGVTATGAASPIMVAGLTNGITYTFTVKATNSAGESVASLASNSVTPATVPGSPTIGTATAGNGQASVTFTAPVLNGGAGITGYTVTSNPGGFTGTGTASPITVTGLTNGTAYTFTVTATNSIGTGGASTASDAVTPATVPGAPTIQTAAAGDGEASVSFTSPTSNGGAEITAYTVTASSGGITATGTASPITVTGLTNGTAYTFTVTATNGVGTGSASSASNSVTPKAAQTITFINPGTQTFGTTPTLTATADSLLEVTFTSATPEVCTITAGGDLTFLKAGEATIVAHQEGSASFLAATDVSQTFTVNAVLPGAPAITAATAGDGRATVTFTAPASNGGAQITSYTVTSNPGGFTASGAGSPITVTGLTNGTAYTFTVTATNAAGNGDASAASASITPRQADSDRDSSAPSAGGVPVIVNGESQNMGSQQSQTVDGKTVTTVSVDNTKLEQKLTKEGTGATVTIPINSGADVAVGALNGQTVKNMESKDAVLQITTPTVTYTLPASEINIDDVSGRLGETVALKDIAVKVSISNPPEDTVQIAENTADKNSYQLIVRPVDFEITCTSGDKTVQVSKFNGYVERTVAIPDGIDPAKITTGIVLNKDGTFSHVPTTIVVIDGKYFAKINSLTNSTYSVIYNPIEFADMAAHWAKSSVNNMGARLVVTGTGGGNYEPDSLITRAQFAAIVVRALGLTPGTDDSSFDDVKPGDWYCGYVETAIRYGIITGYGNGNFGPNDKITREQAMLMISRAMKITGLDAALTDSEAAELLKGFADAGDVPGYAAAQIAACLKTGVITGRDGSRIAPKDTITRAEVAVIVERLLQKSGLI